MRREHVHFVDQVNLVTPLSRRILNVVEEFPGLVDARSRSGVNFDEIDKPAGINLLTGRTLIAWLWAYTALTVQRLRKDSCNGCFTNSARAGKKERMVQSFAVQCICQGADNMFLPHNVVKGRRMPDRLL